MQEVEETEKRKVTSPVSSRRGDFFNLRCSRNMKLVLKFQKPPLINKNFSLKMVINQGPVQSRESDAFIT